MEPKKQSTKKRRVSFNLPEPANDSDGDKPTVSVSVSQDEISYDSDVETPETGFHHSDSEFSSDGSERGDDVQDLSTLKSDLPDDEEGNQSAEDDEEGSESEGDSEEGSESEDDDNVEEMKGKEGEGEAGSGEEASDVEVDSDLDGGAEHEIDGEGHRKEEGPSGLEKEDETSKAPSPVSAFSELALDPRLERAIERLGWKKPSPVQSTVIPAALAARDLLVSAPTGSGKTGCYAVPIVQHICRTKRKEGGPRAVVLVPTRELVYQVVAVFKSLCKYLEDVFIESVAKKRRTGGKGGASKAGTGTIEVSSAADIVVGTPAAIVLATEGVKSKVLSEVDFVVVDEADLALSYGHTKNAQTALERIPRTAQAMLLSATLETEGMESFKKIVLRRPLTIKVTAEDDMKDGDLTGAMHYVARLKSHRDRFLVAYAMLRLNVISGKVLIFVNHINAAFRLKLFLDQFKVKSVVLNSELPANSRMHCVQQFNAGVFDILIASDESGNESTGKGDEKKKQNVDKVVSKKRRRIERDDEFGLSRGVDFRDVAAVFNFDVPDTSTSYTHRAGRTARAGKSGTVLTLICTEKEEKAILNMGRDIGIHIGPLAFRMDQIEAFRYRVEDCLRMVTVAAVTSARMADIKREIINSEKLHEYFEDNPRDLDALQHDLSLAKNVPEHLAHIPSYLLPPALRGSVNTDPQGSKFRKKRKRGSVQVRKHMNGDSLKCFTNKGAVGSSRNHFHTRRGKVSKKPVEEQMKGAVRPIRKRRRKF